MKKILCLCLLVVSFGAGAQTIDSIFFNLYTDSLKKGVHNYINVVGKYSNGRYLPLTDSDVNFSSSAGRWEGNSLIVDTAYSRDSVVVHASLKNGQCKPVSTVIYMKRRLFEGVLKTEQELLDEWNKPRKKKKNSTR